MTDGSCSRPPRNAGFRTTPGYVGVDPALQGLRRLPSHRIPAQGAVAGSTGPWKHRAISAESHQPSLLQRATDVGLIIYVIYELMGFLIVNVGPTYFEPKYQRAPRADSLPSLVLASEVWKVRQRGPSARDQWTGGNHRSHTLRLSPCRPGSCGVDVAQDIRQCALPTHSSAQVYACGRLSADGVAADGLAG